MSASRSRLRRSRFDGSAVSRVEGPASAAARLGTSAGVASSAPKRNGSICTGENGVCAPLPTKPIAVCMAPLLLQEPSPVLRATDEWPGQ